VRIASISTARSQTVLTRAKAEPVPDLQIRAGAEYSGEQLTGINRSVGWEGIAESRRDASPLKPQSGKYRGRPAGHRPRTTGREARRADLARTRCGHARPIRERQDHG
jgi:hypothetical protein